MNQFWEEAAKQVPALAVLVFCIIVFLKHLAIRDHNLEDREKRFIDYIVQRDSRDVEVHKEWQAAAAAAQEAAYAISCEMQATVKEATVVLTQVEKSLGRIDSYERERQRRQHQGG